jgi:hypothetical protein
VVFERVVVVPARTEQGQATRTPSRFAVVARAWTGIDGLYTTLLLERIRINQDAVWVSKPIGTGVFKSDCQMRGLQNLTALFPCLCKKPSFPCETKQAVLCYPNESMKTKAAKRRVTTHRLARKDGRVPLNLMLPQELIAAAKHEANRLQMDLSEYVSLTLEIAVLKEKIPLRVRQELAAVFGLDFSAAPTSASQLEKMNRILHYVAENPTADIATLIKAVKENEFN